MSEPLFWLGLSLCLVSVSLTALLFVAVPTMLELARAARSAEKLFDTLRQELPSTLNAIRLTGSEIGELTEEINSSVKSANEVAKQVDQSINYANQQIKEAKSNSRSVLAGIKAAWKTWNS